MASGNTLLVLNPLSVEPPPSAFATLDLRNQHPLLEFDTTTAEAALWTAIMPRHYAGGGITVYLHWTATTAVTGTVGWTVEIERMSDSATDIDSDSFASAQTVTAATVPGTSGVVAVSSVAISNGANMDSVVAGDSFRIRIKRDVANDNAAGDAELLMIEIKET
jgi:hypothetical protein